VPVSEKQFLFMISEAPYFALSIMRVLAELPARRKSRRVAGRRSPTLALRSTPGCAMNAYLVASR